MTRSFSAMALVAVLFSSAASASTSDEDVELMKRVDTDAFDMEVGDEEQWEVPDDAKLDAAGDDPDEGFGPVGEDPDEGLGPVGEDPDEGFAPVGEGFGDDPPGDFASLGEDPAEDLGVTSAPSAPAARPAAGKGLNTDGKAPLAGSFDASIVLTDVDAVTVELPVLVARSAVTWDDSDYWLVAEFTVKGKKVGEARHLVSKAHLSDLAPTVAWLKAQVPVLEQRGDVQVQVSKVGDGGSAKQLFSKTVPYSL